MNQLNSLDDQGIHSEAGLVKVKCLLGIPLANTKHDITKNLT